MKKNFLFTIFLFSGSLSTIAQSNVTAFDKLIKASHHDTTKLLMYIDTIDKYLYRDNKIVNQAIEEAKAIFEKNKQMPNSISLKYATNIIYYELSKNDLLSSYQVIKDYEYLLNDKNIPDNIRGRFNYINGFTHMVLGDIRVAQKIYYDLVEDARTRKDTSLMNSSLYSLGQLYADEKEYDSALKNFLSLIETNKNYKEKPSTIALINYELSQTYIGKAEYDKALQVISNSMTFLEKEKIDDLKTDFLFLQGDIAIQQNDLTAAQRIYQQVVPLVIDNKDPVNEVNAIRLHAELLTLQQEYPIALGLYDSLIVQFDSTQLELKHSVLGEAHKVAFKADNHLKAYQYASKQNEINKELQEKKKQQETAYLKIKFESDQKEKENKELAIEILQEQTQNRLLYFISSIFLLGLLMLFIAFYQKRKYSETLQKEVKKRTHELQISNLQLEKKNKELFQFSYIFSHDFTAPVQNIKNFLGIIEKEHATPSTAHFFNFTNKNLKRLSNLIEQIRIYFDINNDEKFTYEVITIKDLQEIILRDLSELISSTNALLTIENNLLSNYINCPKSALVLLLKTLIQNALKFNDSSQPTINIQFTQKPDLLTISVADNGIGIDEQYLDYIFEPFKTLESRHAHNSTGLGLAICKKIVLALDGDIKVVSKLGSGSVFHITFKDSETTNEIVSVVERRRA